MIHQLLELYSNQQRPTYLHIDMLGRSPHLPLNGVCAGVSSRHYPALPCPALPCPALPPSLRVIVAPPPPALSHPRLL